MRDAMREDFRPEPLRRVLDNGLVVLAMERRHLPTISATLLLSAGTAAEPADRSGAAFFTSLVLPMGTGKRSAVDLAEEVDTLGGTLGASCGLDYATVEITCLERNAPALLDILAEVALEPAFARQEVDRRRTQILGILERRKDDYSEVARERHARMIFGSHPYHRVREGSEDSIQKMTPDDLADFHRGHYTPEGTVLAMVGDLDAAKAVDWACQRFGPWEPRKGGAVGLPPVAPPESRSLETIQEEVQQAYIRIGNLGFKRDHSDYPAAVVMNYILGGAGFGSRLMQKLREEKGLTYGISSGFRLRRAGGSFSIATQTGLVTMNETLVTILAEIDRFLDNGVTEEEVAWAKRFITGSLPLTLETNDQIAQKLLEQEFFGLPEGFWLDDLEKMQEVTCEDVLAVARRRIDRERFSIVVLSDFGKSALDPGFTNPA